MILTAAKAVRVEDEVARRGGLNLKLFGAELVGACPQCGGADRFAVNIRKQVFLCRGCDARGDIVSMVQFLDRCDFRTAVRRLAGYQETKPIVAASPPTQPVVYDGTQNTERALELWGNARGITGTIVERYLRYHRGLDDLPGSDVIRLLRGCPFGPGRREVCAVLLYRNILSNAPQAILRVALDSDGGKIGRMTLGPVGGAAIKIDHDTNIEQGLVVGEGFETCLASRQFGFRPVWSVGSAAGIRSFPVLPGIDCLTILVDHDHADRNGRQAGQEAALSCSARWTAAGVEVRRIVPRDAGADMADLVAQGGHRAA
jgi:hypothetical protein